MHAVVFLCLAALGADAQQLKPGDSTRTLQMGDQQRSYLVHVPPQYDPSKPTPVVLALHGAWTNGKIMQMYCGLNRTADEKGFVVVYPNGTGVNDVMLFWNSGHWPARGGRQPPDDIAYFRRLLDDLGTVVNVDPKRVFATGISNGGMMCHRLASELSDRIAAIAPVSGTICFDEMKSKRPVSVLEFHGTADKLVPYDGSKSAAGDFLGCKSVDDTIKIWVKVDGCPEKPKTEMLPDKADDGTTVRRTAYGPGKNGSEVVQIEIIGGGHTWPGAPAIGPSERLLGKTTRDISANEMIWDFFEKHGME